MGSGISVRGMVWRFTMAGLIAMSIVAVVLALISRKVSTERAIDEARQAAVLTGEGIVEPALDDAILRLDPGAIDALDAVVRQSVLRGSLFRVKVWRADGTIVYSDVADLIGERFTPEEEQLDVLQLGGVEAEISELDRDENRFEVDQGRLLEVYLQIRSPSGQPLIYETYFRYDGVSEAGTDVWLSFAPASLGALLLLQLIQIPLAWSLARRVHRGEQERVRLLRKAIDSSDAERRRIARDLHDGVVQDLTGISFTLGAASRRAGDGADPVLEPSAQKVRDTVQSLRSLLVDIYPPNLLEEGLQSALSDLMAGLRSRGIETHLNIEMGDHDPDAATTNLFYRVAQEATRNVLGHADANRVGVDLVATPSGLLLTIEDDGRGFMAETARAAFDDGHLGLRIIGELVADADGELRIESAPQRGTRVTVRMPIT